MRPIPEGIDVVRVTGNRFAHWAWAGHQLTLCGYATGDLLTRRDSMPICRRCVREYANGRAGATITR